MHTFAPGRLEALLDDLAPANGMTAEARKARLWDHYCAKFAHIEEQARERARLALWAAPRGAGER